MKTEIILDAEPFVKFVEARYGKAIAEEFAARLSSESFSVTESNLDRVLQNVLNSGLSVCSKDQIMGATFSS